MTADAASAGFCEQTVAEMAADPATQNMIFSLQDEAGTMLSEIIDKTAAILMQDAERSLNTAGAQQQSQQSPLLGTRLESTRRRQAWQKARELAEMLVIGALINKDNPDWNPADPSSCTTGGGQGALLSLVRLEPKEEAVSVPAV